MAARFTAGDVLPGPVSRWRGLFPPAQWLPAYRAQWLPRDLIAGVTLAAYAVPVAMAYASLAGLPPQSGIYGYLLGGVLYALFGTSRQKVHAEATPVHLVVWDLSTSPYVDVVGVRMLADLEEAWARQGIQLRLADAHADVRDVLRAEGLEARVSRIDRRTSVEDIVAGFRPVA